MAPTSIDPSLFALLVELERHAAILRSEFGAVAAEHFLPWPVASAYTGSWSVFALHMATMPDGIEPDFASNREMCPETWRIMRAYPQILRVGVSRLQPATHIFPHTDGPQPRELRAHMGLRVHGATGMRVAGQEMRWEAGRFYLFDPSVEHEAANLGDEVRDVMLLDFVATPEEWQRLREWSRGAGAGVPLRPESADLAEA